MKNPPPKCRGGNRSKGTAQRDEQVPAAKQALENQANLAKLEAGIQNEDARLERERVTHLVVSAYPQCQCLQDAKQHLEVRDPALTVAGIDARAPEKAKSK